MTKGLDRFSTNHLCAAALVSTLSKKGVTDVVISPGSRNAPLTIAFTEDPSIKTHVVIDERSAAHVALGLALETGKPAAVVCTSGTAAINHGPALAEAFHQNTPLISITADRPLGSFNKGLGQSVNQTEIFSNFTLKDYSLNGSSHKQSDINKVVENVINLYDTAVSGGPVHINVHLEEPLYGKSCLESISVESDNIDIEADIEADLDFSNLPDVFVENTSRTLIIAGPIHISKWAGAELNGLAGISESFSGIKGRGLITSGDFFLAGGNWKDGSDLSPGSVITVGNPTMSKTLRNWVTDLNIPHIHLGNSEKDGFDSFNNLEKSIRSNPIKWLSEFSKAFPQDVNFLNAWAEEKKRLENIQREFSAKASWSDLSAFLSIFKHFHKSAKTTLHFANSTSTRYALLFEVTDNLRLHANRGVAGIDGCTSTAVGHALSTEDRVTIVTGDVAFLYDINGLATVSTLPNNLNVIVINNGGGEIFRWLNGPDKVGLLESHFETRPKTSIKAAATFCGLPYFCGVDLTSTQKGLIDLDHNNGPAILEIVTNPEESSKIYKQLLLELKS